MTKHINSSEALPSEAHLWLMPHTQTAIKETKTICIYPETSIENSDTIPFTIPALPKCQLENIKVVAEIKVTNEAGAALAAKANVSVAPHLAAVLFQNVVASIGNQQITQSFDNSFKRARFPCDVLPAIVRTAGPAPTEAKSSTSTVNISGNKAQSKIAPSHSL